MMMQAKDRQIELLPPSAIIHPTANSSSFLTDAKIDATYNRTPLELNVVIYVDKPTLTIYN